MAGVVVAGAARRSAGGSGRGGHQGLGRQGHCQPHRRPAGAVLGCYVTNFALRKALKLIA